MMRILLEMLNDECCCKRTRTYNYRDPRAARFFYFMDISSCLFARQGLKSFANLGQEQSIIAIAEMDQKDVNC